MVEPDVTELDMNRLSRWQKVSCMQQLFWKKWCSEYLTLQQQRTKWAVSKPNIQSGSMVLVRDENLPPLKWPLGRVVEAICGEDGVVRVATVRTAAGIVKRAVAKLCVLPAEVDAVETTRVSTGGVCSEME